MDNKEKRRINRSLRSAQAYASWGLLGIAFPIIGLILGGIAVNKTKVVDEDYDLSEDQEIKLDNIRNQAYVVMVLSVISFAIWAYIYSQTAVQP